MMDRNTFLNDVSSRRKKTVDIFGRDVRLQNLTTLEMRILRGSLVNKKGEPNQARLDRLRELLIVRCVIDDDDALLFTESDAMDGTFDQIDGAWTERLFNECREWTGFASDDDWSAIEDAAKNSNGAVVPASSGD